MRQPHYIALALVGLLHSAAAAHPVDDAFRKADSRTGNKVELSVASSVSSDIGKAQTELGAKVDAGDRKARERNAMGSSPAADAAPTNSAAPWKLVKQYEGGFADFGFDTHHTIHLVRCRSGAEHKLYRDGKGKWGSVGLGGNNSAPSFEMAASQKCS